MIAETYNTVLQLSAKIINEVKNNFTNYYTSNSLVEATKLTRVEPMCVISKDCLSLEITKDVLDVKLNMFAAYYLQAVSLLTKVNNVEVIRVLDKLNPDRDGSGFLLSNQYAEEAASLSLMENYEYALPSLESFALENNRYNINNRGGAVVTDYSNNDNSRNTTNHNNNSTNNSNNRYSSSTSTTNNIKQEALKLNNNDKAVDRLDEMASLATGRLMNVEIAVPNEEGKTVAVVVPVSVRLMPALVSNSTISHLLSFQSEDTSMKERYHQWRAGRLNLISDLIFCQDLIDEYKRAHMGDNSGTMAEISRRVSNAKKYGLLTKNPSLAAASNLFVISKNVALDVEQRLRGKLSNFKTREKAFTNTYAMIIAVVDPETDRVTFYTRGQQASADFSFREIKAAGKGSKGPDVMDIMKAMQQSAPISF